MPARGWTIWPTERICPVCGSADVTFLRSETNTFNGIFLDVAYECDDCGAEYAARYVYDERVNVRFAPDDEEEGEEA